MFILSWQSHLGINDIQISLILKKNRRLLNVRKELTNITLRCPITKVIFYTIIIYIFIFLKQI